MNAHAVELRLSAYSDYVNPQWVRLLDLLEMNVRYERCLGSELFDSEGRRYLDCFSGYCVQNIGHNHPAVIEALREELAACGPTMVQSHVPQLAGELAGRLCGLAGGKDASATELGVQGQDALVSLCELVAVPGFDQAQGAKPTDIALTRG